ncbi:MAG: hypothetical protein AAFQ10_05405 [Pseudomonadota bacterium]
MNIKTIIAVVGMAALAGCSGTTYGTGVTQEQQLVTDVSSMLTLSRGERKKIDYSARSGLVKPSKTSTLPPPAETVSSQSAYFPQNPEELESRLRDEADREQEILASGGQLSPELLAAREAARKRNKRSGLGASRADTDGKESYQEIVARQKEYKRRKALREGEFSPKARKYLTQPPVEYRTPAQTAAIGEVGEKEKDPNVKKKRNSLWKTITGS